MAAVQSPTGLFEAYVAATLKAVPTVIPMVETESAVAADALLDLVAVELQLFRLAAIGVAEQKVVSEASTFPEEVRVARHGIVTALFESMDLVQAELMGWGWALAMNAGLAQALTAAQVPPETAEGVAALFDDRLFARFLSTGLTAGDEDGAGGAAEVSPFATLLRQHYPAGSFSIAIDPATGLSAYPSPVVVEGLPKSLVTLCGLYQYAGTHESKPYFSCKANNYYCYFCQTDNRWFVSPNLGDKNILCFKEAVSSSELLPSVENALQFWDGTSWGQAENATLAMLPDRLWTAPRWAKRKRTE